MPYAVADKSEDSDTTIEEVEAPKKTRTKASIKKNIAAKRGVVMPSIAVSDEDSPAPRSRRTAAQRRKKYQVCGGLLFHYCKGVCWNHICYNKSIS